MILLIAYIIFIIWFSLTIKNKTKNLYNADLSKKVHMYMYIWMFILVVTVVVKTIQSVDSIWVLIMVLVVLKEYVILILRIIFFRIYFETKKIHNYHMIFNFQHYIYYLVGYSNLVRYLDLKLFIINSLKVILPVILCFNTNTLIILLLILVLMDLKSKMFNFLLDDACIRTSFHESIELTDLGKQKIKQYQNNLMNVKVVNYRESKLLPGFPADFYYTKDFLNY